MMSHGCQNEEARCEDIVPEGWIDLTTPELFEQTLSRDFIRKGEPRRSSVQVTAYRKCR